MSPLEADGYAEYRDSEFLDRVALNDLKESLSKFWPRGGPCWDALARIDGGCLLVEAKSHISEIECGGCKASAASKIRINKAFEATKCWLKVSTNADWEGRLYQCANRYAHLYYLTQVARVRAFLVNVYFVQDPWGQTSRKAWETAITSVKRGLGLESDVAFSGQVFLLAR